MGLTLAKRFHGRIAELTCVRSGDFHHYNLGRRFRNREAAVDALEANVLARQCHSGASRF
jgi:hypothetical protein